MAFSHRQLNLQRIKRTFVLEHELTLKTQVKDFEVQVSNGHINLTPLLSIIVTDIKNLSFKIYNFRNNNYMEFENCNSTFRVPRYILDESPHVVLIKYSHNISETMSMNSLESHINQENKSDICSKGERSKERLLLEVIQIVKKWRNLHETRRGKAKTLPEAAQILGLPKKSLDDYYYQLRMGEKYGFDFHAHMMDGIGVLRSFLKKFKIIRRGDKTQKLPTSLKIANQIDHYDSILKPMSEHQGETKVQKMEEERSDLIIEEPFKKDTIEKTFYSEFNLDFGKENDPFLNLGKINSNKDLLNVEMGSGSNFDLFF